MLNIAIDGPSGSGKSTIARGVAHRLNILHLDTGAMYRALALKALRLGLEPCCRDDILPILPTSRITATFTDGVQRTLIDGEDVSALIRTQEVAKGASDIGTIAEVRSMMVAAQREIALATDVIMDGRDIGSCVMPDTKYKFYVTASLEVRASRRLAEMREKDAAYAKTLDEMLSELAARDATDTGRAASPLVRLRDAVLVDTTEMSIDESVDYVLGFIGQAGKDF